MSVQLTATHNPHADLLTSVRAEIAATGVFEHAAEAARDTKRAAALDAHERGLWDALAHLIELGGERA